MSEEKFNSDLNRTGELSNHVKFFEYKDTFELSSGEKLSEIKELQTLWMPKHFHNEHK